MVLRNVYRQSLVWRSASQNYFRSHNAKTQFVLTIKFRMVTKGKYLKRNKSDCVIYRNLKSLNNSNEKICVSLAIHVIPIGCVMCDVVHCCRHLLSLATKNCTSTVGIKESTWKRKVCTKLYRCTMSQVPLTANISVLIKTLLSSEIGGIAKSSTHQCTSRCRWQQPTCLSPCSICCC